MTTFKQQLDRAYKKKVLDRFDKTVRAVALVVDKALIDATPVDTGRARANWLPSLNVPDVSIVPPSESGTTNSVKRKGDVTQALAAYTLADTILITNNLPYIQELNNGSSIQAPAGFVDEALAKGKRAVIA